MVKVGIKCYSCAKELAIEVRVGHATPRWAMRLWKKALALKWARRANDHAVFCSDCRELMDAPSEQVVPLEPIQFITLLECEGCGTQFEGDEAVFESHFNRNLRTAAREHGWVYISLDRGKSYHDYCPTCEPEAKRHRRERLMRMVWTEPTQAVALDLGVSDKAIEKRCKRWGVPKPPRGFWAKWHAGYMEDCRALIPEEVCEVLGARFLDEVYPLERSDYS